MKQSHENPGRVSQQSEGLRVSALPWKNRMINAQPRRGCLFTSLHRVKWATLSGLMIHSSAASRVASLHSATLRFVGKPLRGCKPMNTNFKLSQPQRGCTLFFRQHAVPAMCNPVGVVQFISCFPRVARIRATLGFDVEPRWGKEAIAA